MENSDNLINLVEIKLAKLSLAKKKNIVLPHYLYKILNFDLFVFLTAKLIFTKNSPNYLIQGI